MNDNIYWLFSTSAQAIAAFIGLISAGFFFVYEKLDKNIEKDETLEEAYKEIKEDYYSQLKFLFILTGITLLLSFIAIYLNGLELKCINGIILIIVSLITVANIYFAIKFVINIIDPRKVEKAVQKLVEENKSVFLSDKVGGLTRGEFLDKFIKLEEKLRNIAKEYKSDFTYSNKYKNFTPLSEILRNLFQRELISSQQLRDLNYLNKIRNLAAHGEIQHIENRQGEIIDELILQLNEKYPGFM